VKSTIVTTTSTTVTTSVINTTTRGIGKRLRDFSINCSDRDFLDSLKKRYNALRCATLKKLKQ
jgi:hypothetical protein